MSRIPGFQPGQDPHDNRTPEQLALRSQIRERAVEQIGWLDAAAKVVGGPNAVFTEVFDRPPETRDDAPLPDWTEDQISAVQKIARDFGYGAHETVPAGFTGGHLIFEGGKAWKIAAEVAGAKEVNPNANYIFAGSPYVRIDDAQRAFAEKKYGQKFPSDLTEYDFAQFVAKQEAQGELFAEPVVEPFGYETTAGNPTMTEPTGQLVQVGTTATGKKISVLRIDRELLDDNKYANQPDSSKLMGFIADTLTAQGNTIDPVGLVTSGTYASRRVDAIRAGLQNNRQFGVVMYGRKVLTALQEFGANVPKEAPLNQLPGDLRSTYDKLQQLVSELDS